MRDYSSNCLNLLVFAHSPVGMVTKVHRYNIAQNKQEWQLARLTYLFALVS